MILVQHQPTMRADMGSHVHVLGDQLLAPAAKLACVIGVNKRYLSSGACSLGDTEGLELSPASIQNRQIQTSFGAGSIGQICAIVVWVGFGVRRLTHVGDIHFFKDERAKAIHQSTRCLVLKVRTLIADLAVSFCQGNGYTFVATRAFLLVVFGLL